MIDPVAFSIGLLRARARLEPRRELRPEALRAVGVVELTRMGDVLSALPAVRALAHSMAGSTIHFFVEARWAPLAEALLPAIEVRGLDGSDSAIGLMAASRRVRELGLDLAISLSPSKRNALLCLSSGSPMKGGYLGYANTLTPFLGRYPIEGFGVKLRRTGFYAGENIYRRAALVLEALGLEGPDDLLVQRDYVDRAPQERDHRPFVALHPFSGWEGRSWPVRSFAQLAESILTMTEVDVTFLYAPEDTRKAGELIERFSHNDRARFVSTQDLRAVARVLGRAEAFVGNDSGPLHLAASLGVPVIGLYGAAPPELTAPPHARGTMLYKKVECSPCDQRYCRLPQNSCMMRIAVDEVLRALEGVLKSCETPADG